MSGAGVPPAPPGGDGGGGNRRRRRRGRGGRGGSGERGAPGDEQQQGRSGAPGERPPQQDRPKQQDRGAQQDRPQQQDRGAQQDRPQQQDRGAQQDRPQQQNRPPQDRARDDRAPRRDDRGPRRDDRGPRRDDRAPQQNRAQQDRPQQARQDRPQQDRPREDRGPRRDERGPRRDERGPRQDERGPRQDQARPFATTRTEPPQSSTVDRPALAAPPPSLAPLAHPSADIDAGWGTPDLGDEPHVPAAAAVAVEVQRTLTPAPVREPRDPDGEDIFAGLDAPVPPGAIANVAGVKFRDAGTIYEFDAGDASFLRGDRVVVESDRGPLVGTVAVSSRRLPVLDPLRRIVRRATTTDEGAKDRNAAKEREAYLFCKQRIRDRGLGMKLVRVEYPLAGGKVLFYFASEERVDFRDLVKDLASRVHARIEMRQIGARDEAKMVGGIGSCGRELCCSTWLPAFVPVSIKMAKDQGLVLNPSKVSGQCGRLKCCLVYEHDLYKEMRKGLPKVGKRVKTPAGTGKVVELDVLQQKVRVWFDEGGSETFPPDVLEVLQPPPQLGKGGKLPMVPPDDE
jgi:cell fate regulator YaaT (PSP1 superfamily)